MNLKRIICCMLVAMMLLPMLIGCTSKEPGGTTTKSTSGTKSTTASTTAGTTATTAAPKEFEYVIGGPVTDKEGVVISILTHSGATSVLLPASSDLPIYKAMEDRLNVKFDWQILDFSTYNETFSVRMVSSDLPDIAVGRDHNIISKLVKDGYFISYDDLDFEKNAPYAIKLFTEESDEYGHLPGLWRQLYGDGKMYSFGNTVVSRFLFWNLMINQIWLKELNLPEPSTLDEFYEMLVAFRDNDPNKNNKKDEIPMANMLSGAHYGLAPAFSINWAVPWSVDANGKLEYDLVSEKYREYLRYLNKLYSDDLIDKETRDLNAHYELIGQDRLGVMGYYATFSVAFTTTSPHSYPPDTPAEETWPVFLEMVPLQNIYTGERFRYPRVPSVATLANDGMFILKKAEEPEICLRIVDWMWASEEHVMLRNFGIKDLNYKIGEDGKPEKLPEGGDYLSLGGGQPPYANRQILWIMRDKQLPWVTKRADEIKYKEGLQPFILNADETAKLSTIQTDLNTCRDEWTTSFIHGRKSLDTDWDGYLKAMEAAGLKEFLAIYQENYDRNH